MESTAATTGSLTIHQRPSLRATAALAQERNRLVGALATELMIPHAHPGGQLDRLCRELATGGSTVWTLDASENDVTAQAGVRTVASTNFAREWRDRFGNPSGAPPPRGRTPATHLFWVP